MSLFALITALLLEQFHPLSSRRYLYGWLSGTSVLSASLQCRKTQTRQDRLADRGVAAAGRCHSGVLAAVSRASLLAWAFNVLCCTHHGLPPVQPLISPTSSALRAGKLDGGARYSSQYATMTPASSGNTRDQPGDLAVLCFPALK